MTQMNRKPSTTFQDKQMQRSITSIKVASDRLPRQKLVVTTPNVITTEEKYLIVQNNLVTAILLQQQSDDVRRCR
jgi:hypothetical protein